MTGLSQSEDNRSPGEKTTPPVPHAASAPSADPTAADMKSEVMTEKFLTVAKEKKYLESLIMSQNDIIKGLENEKEKLTLSLKKFAASHKSMKEKLLDFDMLRNMEISELKEKIEYLIADNKRLVSEKDSIFRNLERDQKNISRLDNQVVESLMREKKELEERLRKTLGDTGREDERGMQTAADRDADSSTSLKPPFITTEDPEDSIATAEPDLEDTRVGPKTTADESRKLEREISLARSQVAEIELDRDEARAELYSVRVELEHLKADKSHVEENLQQKVHDYSREISELKTDIDELTSAIESKIHFIDELNAKVVRLSDELSHKDSELHEKIPALLDKINSLSQSIDMKMEENSLFAKELFDLNVKISTLNEEMIEKDELLIDISEDYRKQKNEIEALHGAHELTLKNLVYERDLLIKENEDRKALSAVPLQQLEQEQQDKIVLEGRLSEQLNTLDELTRQNDEMAVLTAEKDLVISDLQGELVLLRSKAEGAAVEHAESLVALREQVSSLNQQLLEKNEMVDALTSERSKAAEADQIIAGLQKELSLYQSRLEETAAEHASGMGSLREKIALLNQQLLEKNELLTVTASERDYTRNEFSSQTDLLRKEITGLNEELNRLRARGLEQEEDLERKLSHLDIFQKEKTGLEEDLAQAAQKINELVLELDRLTFLSGQKEQTLSDARTEISVLQEKVAALQTTEAELKNQIQERHEISDLTDARKEKFQKTALEYQETFEQLKQEIISLNRNLAEKERVIDLLHSEQENFDRTQSDQQVKLDQSLTFQRDLQMQLNESMREISGLNAENSDLTNTIARLQNEIAEVRRTGDDEVTALKDDLSSYGAAVAELRLTLEQKLLENSDLRSKLQTSGQAGQEAATPVMGTRVETLPARIEKSSRAGIRPLAYGFLALLLLSGIGFSFYAYNTGLIPDLLQKPETREIVKKELPYNDMFSLLTKASASDALKFQATLLTSPLVLKSETPGENALFDFQNYLYFKVNISSPRDGLDDETADNPYELITLTVGADAVKPLSNIRVKDSKTFYRKEEPVSITFYCAFPKTALKPDTNALSLSFISKKGRTDLVWDLKALRAGNLFP